MQNQKSSKTGLVTFQIIWVALLFSQIVYTVIGFMMYGSPELITDHLAETNVLILFVVGIVVVISGFLILNFITKMSPKLNSIEEARQKFFVPFIIRLVLIESCAIYGLVASGLVDKNLTLNFSAISFVAFLFCFPTEKVIRDFMKKTAFSR